VAINRCFGFRDRTTRVGAKTLARDIYHEQRVTGVINCVGVPKRAAAMA